MNYSGDYSMAIWAQSKLKNCEEIKKIQNQRATGVAEWLKNTDFRIQYISTIKRFFLVTKSEFILPNPNYPILREELALSSEDDNLVYSVFLRPVKNELHLILALSRSKISNPEKEYNTYVLCDYILPVGVINSRTAHIFRLKRSGWTCKNHKSEESRNIFGEVFQTRPIFEDKNNDITIVTLIK